MKVVEFMDMQSTKFGGLGHFMLRLMAERPNDKFYFVFQRYPKSKEMVDAFQSAGAEIIVIDTEGKKAIVNIPEVYKFFKKVKPDIVHFHFANGFFFFAPMAKMLGVKHLFKTQHCCITTNDMRQVKDKRELSLKTKLASRNGKVYKLFDKIIMCGEYVKKQFIEVYGEASNYEMIYFGVEPVALLNDEKKQELKRELHIAPKDKVITSVLFADPVKGPDIIIKAMSYLKDKDVVLLLVGINDDLPLAKELHRLSIELVVENKIRWIGITNHVNHYLSIADIYCQPSRSEALTLAVCEAKSAHLPIVGSNVGGLTEISNITFENENPKDLAKQLSLLIDNEELRKSFAAKSYQEYLDKFDIAVGARKYAELYNCR